MEKVKITDINCGDITQNSLKNYLLFTDDKFQKVFDIWSKYEDIAMHFNDLLIKLRVQALGGIAIIGTVATAFLKENNTDLTKYLLPLSFLLSVGWLALYCLDMYYYNCLLSGAVKTIKDIEKETNTKSIEGEYQIIQLSTNIVDEVSRYKIFKRFSGRRIFYFLVFMILLISNFYYLCLSLGYQLHLPLVFVPVFLLLLLTIPSFFSVEPTSDSSSSAPRRRR